MKSFFVCKASRGTGRVLFEQVSQHPLRTTPADSTSFHPSAFSPPRRRPLCATQAAPSTGCDGRAAKKERSEKKKRRSLRRAPTTGVERQTHESAAVVARCDADSASSACSGRAAQVVLSKGRFRPHFTTRPVSKSSLNTVRKK